MAVEQTLAEKAEKVGSWRARPATGSLLSLSACQVRWELRERRGSRGGSLSPAGTTTREREKESKHSKKTIWRANASENIYDFTLIMRKTKTRPKMFVNNVTQNEV